MNLSNCNIDHAIIRRADGRLTIGRIVGIDPVFGFVLLEKLPHTPAERVTERELADFEPFNSQTTKGS